MSDGGRVRLQKTLAEAIADTVRIENGRKLDRNLRLNKTALLHRRRRPRGITGETVMQIVMVIQLMIVTAVTSAVAVAKKNYN